MVMAYPRDATRSSWRVTQRCVMCVSPAGHGCISERKLGPLMTSIATAHPASPPVTGSSPHQSYIPPSQSPPELTVRAIALGVVLGLIFGASNVYLALKIGLTVSASIPIAVLSITIFRWLGRSTILENNIVQTTGSAADSVSAGGGVPNPPLFFFGFNLDIWGGPG